MSETYRIEAIALHESAYSTSRIASALSVPWYWGMKCCWALSP
jgi:hypothetical protein